MSKELVSYHCQDGIATITMDDGKRNALSPEMFRQLNAAIDRAEREQAMIILTGREGVFSAGFDLKVLRGGNAPQALGMLKAGFAMTARLLSYPRPVIAASSGHAMAMGVFLVLSADYRIGVRGDFKYAANEVAIGLTLPRVAAEVLRMRLTPADFQQAAVLAAPYAPQEALRAGFIDRLVEPAELMATANAVAVELQQLDMRAHEVTKLRVREQSIKTIRRSLPLDLSDALMLGVRSFIEARRA